LTKNSSGDFDKHQGLIVAFFQSRNFYEHVRAHNAPETGALTPAWIRLPQWLTRAPQRLQGARATP
jgi:hypothetical protein